MTERMPADSIELTHSDFRSANLRTIEQNSELFSAMRNREESVDTLRVLLDRIEGKVQVAGLDAAGDPVDYMDLESAQIIPDSTREQGFLIAGFYKGAFVERPLASVSLRIDPRKIIRVNWDIDGVLLGKPKNFIQNATKFWLPKQERVHETLSVFEEEITFVMNGALTDRPRWLRGISTYDQLMTWHDKGGLMPGYGNGSTGIMNRIGGTKNHVGGGRKPYRRKVQEMVRDQQAREAEEGTTSSRKQVLVDDNPRKLAEAVAYWFKEAKSDPNNKEAKLRALGSIVIVGFSFNEPELEPQIREGIAGYGLERPLSFYGETIRSPIGDKDSGQFVSFIAMPEHGRGPAEEVVGLIKEIDELAA